MSNEILDKICNVRKQFDDLISRHSDDESFTDALKSICDENGFPDGEEISHQYNDDTDMDRLLRIGIVGRVKAGKSSLLNSFIFDGKDILPKAATPMTAALTYLEYGEKISFTVEFFTDQDIQKIEEKAKRYEKELDSRINLYYEKQKNNLKINRSDEEIRKNAESKAVSEMKENTQLAAAYDQYQKIKKSSSDIFEKVKKEAITVTVDSMDKIAGVLSDYVGGSGKYMPFTRNVNIKLPIEDIKEVTIVDTPGFNDPVPSRSEKAGQLLAKCDVVLILTLANQAMSENDKDVIAQIPYKNGIREIFVIASQFDNTLFGGEIVEGSDGNLDNAIEQTKGKITEQIIDVLKTINHNNIFDLIIKEKKKRIFHSSGLCQSMVQTWVDRKNWDMGRCTVWNNLKEWYPDYFSDNESEISMASLEKLGNIEKIKEAITVIKSKKESIFAQKLEDFESRYENCIKKSKKDILEYIEKRKEGVAGADLDKIKSEIERLTSITFKLQNGLKDVFMTAVDEWKIETEEHSRNELFEFLNNIKSDVSNAESSGTDSWTKGWLFWKKEYSEDYSIVNTTDVINSIDSFIGRFNYFIKHFLEKQRLVLIKTLASGIAKFWIRNFVDEDIDETEIRNSVRSIVINSVDINIEYDGDSFNSQHTGRLDHDEAENFLNSAKRFINYLEKKFSELIDEKFDTITSKLYSVDFGKQFLEKYKNMIEINKKEAQNKEVAVANWERIQKEVECIQCLTEI